MWHPVHTHMRAADFKEAVRNPDAASACVTPFGMMQTAVVGSPDLCIFLFAGGREGKGGKGNKLSMPFMRKACLEDGLNIRVKVPKQKQRAPVEFPARRHQT